MITSIRLQKRGSSPARSIAAGPAAKAGDSAAACLLCLLCLLTLTSAMSCRARAMPVDDEAPALEASAAGIASAADRSARSPGPDLQWAAIKRESSLDCYGLATDNEWLTAHYARADGGALEWRYGMLSRDSITERVHGVTLGGELTFPRGRWLRQLDAALYSVGASVQWQGGALFSVVPNRLNVQVQRDVLAWAQALWGTEVAVAGNISVGGVKLNFDYQHYKVSDGNTVQDVSLRLEPGKSLPDLGPLHIQLGVHRRWTTFDSSYYWSPSSPNETLGVEAGIGWQHPRWQFNASIQRNLGLNRGTDPTWGANTSANLDISRTVSIGASYGSSSGAPRPGAYWRQYATVYVRFHRQVKN